MSQIVQGISKSSWRGLKTTVTHEYNMITRAQAAYHLLQHVIDPGHDLAAAIKWRQGNMRIPVNTLTGFEPDLIGGNQRRPEFIRMNTGAHGITAGFESDKDTGITDFSPQAFERKPYGGWVMGEIIDDNDVVDNPAYFLSSFYTVEGTKG